MRFRGDAVVPAGKRTTSRLETLDAADSPPRWSVRRSTLSYGVSTFSALVRPGYQLQEVACPTCG